MLERPQIELRVPASAIKFRQIILGDLFRVQQLLDAIATHRVADRPDRFEPRQRKRRQKKYDRMMKPRNEIKRDILNGLTEI